MKNFLLATSIGLLLILSCSQKSDHFTIIGKTVGFKDSTKLYLQDSKASSLLENVDSTYIINNSFTFKGSVLDTTKFTIHTGYAGWNNKPPESFQYVVFFVDNSTIYINDKTGKLMFSTFSGSQMQDDYTEFMRIYKPFIVKSDSINKIAMNISPTDSMNRKILDEEFTKAFKESERATIYFIENHPNSIISVGNLDAMKTVFGKEKTRYLFSLLNPKIKNTKYGKTLQEYLANSANLQYVKNFGDLNDIELPNLKGELVRLSSVKGKYTLLEFWSAGCGPCRAENPELLKLYNLYKENGFEIYSVSIDENKESWQKAVKDDKINWITVLDSKGEIGDLYQVIGIPKNYLIDSKGMIIANDLRGEKLAAKLKEIFKEL